MSSFAPTLSYGHPRPPSLRLLDDAALGQQIGWALRSGSADETPIIDGYRLEGEPDIIDGVARYDATRDEDGRWLIVEVPTREMAADEAKVAAFARVALVELALRHKNVHAVLEVGTASDGRPFRVREATDSEPLVAVLGRGALPWRRVRGIAMQLCSGLSSARAHGLRPRDLSIVTCRRSRKSVASDDVKLGELEPIGPGDEPHADVPAVATIIEQLSSFGPASDPAKLARLGVPTAELAELLARARSKDPQHRYADAGQLGRAIAMIGRGATSWSRARSNATSGTIMGRGPFVPPSPDTMVVACSRADALTVPAARAVKPLPSVIVAGAVTRPHPRVRRYGALGFSLALVMLVGAASLVSPKVRANAMAVAHDIVQVVDRGLHELEPEAVSPERTPVAMAAIAPPSDFIVTDAPVEEVAPAIVPAVVVPPVMPAPPVVTSPVVTPPVVAPLEIAAPEIVTASEIAATPVVAPAKKKPRRIAKQRGVPKPDAVVVANSDADEAAPIEPAPIEPEPAEPAPTDAAPAVASPRADAVPIPEPS